MNQLQLTHFKKPLKIKTEITNSTNSRHKEKDS